MSKTTFDKTSVTLEAVRAGTLTVRDIDTEFIDAFLKTPWSTKRNNRPPLLKLSIAEEASNT